MSMSSKTFSIYFGIVCFCQIQLAGLIETHLDFDPTTHWQILDSAYLHKSCLKYPQRKFKVNFIETFSRCCSLDIVLMTLFSMTWLFVR